MNPSAPRRPPDDVPEPAPNPSSRSGEAPWRTWAPGVRVVVRRRLPAGSDHLYTDLLGELTAVDDAGVSLATRQGPVHVPAHEIALGKIVPPAPVRRARREHLAPHEPPATDA